MRETTQRPEGIATGNVRLVGVQRDSIVQGLERLLGSPEERAAMGLINIHPYGDGLASTRIAKILADF